MFPQVQTEMGATMSVEHHSTPNVFHGGSLLDVIVSIHIIICVKSISAYAI